ncbi:alpha/beta-hydrolase [Cryphonectria parasitica EP155]|uniref:Alpha/beta-hydrolase n=1 Tax=Cryphonectria parasitica (strain ATCC 38755 / EP155) TaxID=660469 RepID=A0A9P4Y616_CRYP1|nr:alpha/beta-hydrolase [Cryphonectria parasitica EP155]KAF3767141.1 alpha/beta-hydrolase [Cryphonectria parasitica EP155]
MTTAQSESWLTYPVRRERIRIPTRDSGRSITADLYIPSSSSSSFDIEKPRPLLVNWHGSGFVLTGLLRTNALFCARVAHELGILVLDADYRKAPEHPFPAAVHDAEDVLRWVATVATTDYYHHTYQFDPTRVAVSGFSSGGSLALGAASVLRRGSLGLDICGVVGVYPGTDMVTAPADKKPPREGVAPPIDTRTMELFRDCYVPDPSVRADPLASPVRAEVGLYPNFVTIFTCEGDRVAPEGLELVRRLEAGDEGTDGSRVVVSEMMLDVGHGFDAGAEEGTVAWERREEMYQMAVKSLKRALTIV